MLAEIVSVLNGKDMLVTAFEAVYVVLTLPVLFLI